MLKIKVGVIFTGVFLSETLVSKMYYKEGVSPAHDFLKEMTTGSRRQL
jgi:hypothetical protein